MSWAECLALAVIAAAYTITADLPAPVSHVALAAKECNNWTAP